MSDATTYGKRADGSMKGRGYFGELRRPDGAVSTEISIGVNLDNQEREIPVLVPTLSRGEIDRLLAGDAPDDAMVKKAVDHARSRIAAGKNPFAGQDDVPVGIPPETEREVFSRAWEEQEQ